MNYKQRLNARDAFVELMEDEYGIKEITSKTQKKNKTRMFEIPSGETFGVYSSGMVRKVIRSTLLNQYTCYQLNRCHNQESRAMYLNEDGTFKTMVYHGKGRIPIYDEMARLKYLLDYLIKNYDLEKLKTEDIEVIYEIVKPKEDTREIIVLNGHTYVRV